MFETTVVESRKQKVGIQKYLTLPVSLGLHVVVIAGMIFGAVWNVEFPENSPAQVAQYSVAACHQTESTGASSAIGWSVGLSPHAHDPFCGANQLATRSICLCVTGVAPR